MIRLTRFCYISKALAGFATADLRDLQQRAGEFNEQHEVTGLLLFDGARFAQLVEGPEVGMRLVVDRIVNDDRHADLQVAQHGPVRQRLFSDWSLEAEWQLEVYHSDALLRATKAAVAGIAEPDIVAFFIGFARLST